jgi:hypothetical protein
LNSSGLMKYLCLFFSVLIVLTLQYNISAQALISPKGVGAVSVSYQNIYVTQHLFSQGQNTIVRPDGEVDSLLGQIRFQAVFFDISYSITDKLAISGYIPYIAGKYIDDGGNPGAKFGNAHVINNPDGTAFVTIDDGKYHGGFQDIGFRLRYNVASYPMYVTPFIEYNTPSHDYPYYSHAVYGTNVAEFKIGSYFGKLLDPVIPNTFVQGRYAFGFLEEIIGVSRTRHHGEIEVGYLLTPSITVTGLLIGYYTNGGLDLPDDYPPASRTTLNPYWFNHIRVSRDNLLDWGLGFQYAMSDRITLYTGGVRTITARNMHATDYAITLGMSWGFGGSPQRPCHC